MQCAPAAGRCSRRAGQSAFAAAPMRCRSRRKSGNHHEQDDQAMAVDRAALAARANPGAGAVVGGWQRTGGCGPGRANVDVKPAQRNALIATGLSPAGTTCNRINPSSPGCNPAATVRAPRTNARLQLLSGGSRTGCARALPRNSPTYAAPLGNRVGASAQTAPALAKTLAPGDRSFETITATWTSSIAAMAYPARIRAPALARNVFSGELA